MNLQMLSEKSKIAVKHALCAVLTALCALYQHYALYCYTDGDNYGISVVLNGIYGDDNICTFVHPFISYAVKLLCRIFPRADCFALLCWLFMIMAVYAFFLFVLERARGKAGKAAGLLLVFVWIFAICEGLSCNYTVQAAVVSAAGWVCLLTEIGAENPMKALLYRENTYFVQNEKNPQLDFFVRWLREHYDENTQAEVIGETDGCTVWKFSVADENTER